MIIMHVELSDLEAHYIIECIRLVQGTTHDPFTHSVCMQLETKVVPRIKPPNLIDITLHLNRRN
jgi:hypothetical protein